MVAIDGVDIVPVEQRLWDQSNNVTVVDRQRPQVPTYEKHLED